VTSQKTKTASETAPTARAIQKSGLEMSLGMQFPNLMKIDQSSMMLVFSRAVKTFDGRAWLGPILESSREIHAIRN